MLALRPVFYSNFAAHELAPAVLENQSSAKRLPEAAKGKVFYRTALNFTRFGFTS
jgi:hypothetical protein